MGVQGDEFPCRGQGAAPLVGFGVKPRQTKRKKYVKKDCRKI